MTQRVLVVNAGSSSLKLRLLSGTDELERRTDVDLPAGRSHDEAERQSALEQALDGWPEPDLVGHRVVHGGTRYVGAVRVDHTVRQQLADLVDLAPLHQPKSLAALDAVTALYPQVPAVACFDTAFHRSLPVAASTYAVPLEWRTRYGIRRYGFHGLSHDYATVRAAAIISRPRSQLRIVSCHLGAGASLAAVVTGESVDTTMGFTPLEGLVMATRSGSVDPGLLLWLEEHEHLRPADIADTLEHRSGLLALAGSSDLREVAARADRGNRIAREAIEVYLHRLVSGIGSMTASAGGLDLLVFTGGVGENTPWLRRRVAERLAYLGVAVDPDRNDDAYADADISAHHGSVHTVVVTAREDLQIARESRALLR